jgi:hypothetical protein
MTAKLSASKVESNETTSRMKKSSSNGSSVDRSKEADHLSMMSLGVPSAVCNKELESSA